MSTVLLQTPDEVRARLAELRKDYTEIPVTERTDEHDARLKAILPEVRMLDDRLTTLLMFERAEAPTALQIVGDPREFRSGGQMLLENPEMRAWIEHGASAIPGALNVQIEAGIESFQVRAPLADFGTAGPGYNWGNPTYDASNAGYLLPVGQPIPPTPRRARLYMRDLMPVTSTTLARIPYVQELSPTSNEGGATSVAEGTTKPTAGITLTGANADPTVLAVSLQLSRQLFSDAPAAMGYLNARLPYMVKFREDQQFLNGNGTWPDMQGILNTAGIQAQSGTAGDNATTLANAFAKIEISDGSPTAVVLHPTDAWTMFTKRASTSGIFDAGTPFSAIPLSVWGIPTYRTRAKASGSALVGDFQMGGQVFDRQQVSLQTYQERYIDQNLVFLLCEERVGVAWYRPDLFVVATFS